MIWSVYGIPLERELEELEKVKDLRKKLQLLLRNRINFIEKNSGSEADLVIKFYDSRIDQLKTEIYLSNFPDLNENNRKRGINSNSLIEKSFDDYLLQPVPNNLIQFLQPILKGAKGRKVALVILALKHKGYLLSYERIMKGLFKAMIFKFGVTGTYSGVSYYLNSNDKKISNKEIEEFSIKLP